ncbi:MAG TPA: hypothetical protein VIM12_05710 [Noviherbaspirillum sp.]|jgi:hypothetical protein|uniref:hypothetical protein n=1 Tax=Noviherbaspirillum sp. TaxID=1926288 RepID=UPI002F91F1E2
MRWFLIGYPALVATIAVVFLVQYFFCLSAEAWAAWVAALGTLLAFAGTIWLATSQYRLKQKADADIAHLVAARMSGELAAMIDRVEQIQARLTFGNPAELGPAFATHVFALKPDPISALGNADRLVLLSPLPNRAAHRIARAVGMIHGFSEELEPYMNISRWQQVTAAGREHYAKKWSKQIDQIFDLLKVAQLECVKASEIGAPLPTHEEIYGPWITDLEDF